MNDTARHDTIFPIDGVRLSYACTHARYVGRDDLLLISLAPGSTVGGVFTRSHTRSACVRDAQAKIAHPAPPDCGAAFVINAGNANAFTGAAGARSVDSIVTALASATDIPPARIFTASTGVIGEILDPAPIVATLNGMQDSPDTSQAQNWHAAAKAITTTDTYPKIASTRTRIGGGDVHITGIAKGSGMIFPNMGTMLGYIFTDAAIDQPLLQAMLVELNASTFNCITVDGDTSTSDMVLVGATGASGVRITHPDHIAQFRTALLEVMRTLAHHIVRDGEGATKFIEIHVSGARTAQDAHTHACAIANSPLVKTAIAGEDPNWGRIIMALGKSGAEVVLEKIALCFGDVAVTRDGAVHPEYRESDGAAHMRGKNICLRIDLGIANGASTVWTCDLTHAYIDINADYRS